MKKQYISRYNVNPADVIRELNQYMLADGYDFHFDLYDLAMKKGDTVLGEFAPFSHDARTVVKVPEPSSLALMGLCLLGLGFSRRRKLN